MEYRTWEKAQIAPSLLGFGCMRFPLNDDGTIQKEETEKMLDYAISQGVNYIDTAYPYLNQQSERFVGEYLKKYNREDYYLATKLPIWLVNQPEETEEYFEEQLRRLQTDYVDFYLVHAMDRERFEKMEQFHIFERLTEYKNQGKIRFLGFSFHDSYDVFETIIKSHPWDFVQIQYNYMDTDFQAGDKGVKLAGEMGIPLVVMEPIRGGSLLRLPEDIMQVLKDYDPSASLASWPLRWVADHPQVKVVLSGMGQIEQVEENVRTFSDSKPLSKEEKALINQVRSMILERQKSRCTGCEYCMPCPFGVDIPSNFKYWNEDSMYMDQAGKRHYKMLDEKERAANCHQCGKCEKVCPQHISIREDLKQAAFDLQEENN